MNQRSKEILNALIDESAIPIGDLAAIHEVSERTVRNDISSLNDYLENASFGQIVITHKSVHLNLQTSKEKLYQDINKFNVYDYKFSSSERSLICLLILIGSKGYVTLNQLSEKLLTSRSTAVNDVKAMRKLAADHQLKVVSKANRGYRLEANEKDIRVFLHDVLSQENFTILKSLVFEEGFENDIDLAFLQKNLEETRKQVKISEKSLDRILQFLMISAYRNAKGFPLTITFTAANPQLAADIYKSYEAANYPYLMANDIAFIVNQVTADAGQKQLHSAFNKETLRIQIIVMQFIEKLSADLKIDFKDDYIFYENFSAHILRMLRKEDFKEDKSLKIGEIVRSNIKIKEAVSRHLHIIEENIGRKASQTEFNYIIIHVYAAMERKKRIGSNLRVAVLTEKKSTEAFFIESKLVSNFSFHLDIYAIDDAIRGEYDLILTTTPVANKNYIHISPFVTDEDYILIANQVNQIVADREYNDFSIDNDIALKLYQKIAEVIDSGIEDNLALKDAVKAKIFAYAEKPSKSDGDMALYDFLTPDRIQLNSEALDWQDAIYKAGSPLIERGEITKEYLEVVIENIKENGPYVVISKGFAFPHAQLGDYNKKTSMNLIRLKQPVYFTDEERDNPNDIGTLPVRYVCMLSVTDRRKHLKAVFNLFNLLKDDAFRKDLDACETAEAVHYLIEEQEKLLELRR